MKELYNTPTLEIIAFDAEDFITTSPFSEGTPPGNPGSNDPDITI